MPDEEDEIYETADGEPHCEDSCEVIYMDPDEIQINVMRMLYAIERQRLYNIANML